MTKEPLLCISSETGYDIPEIDQLEVIKSVGFDQFFFCERKNQPASEDEAMAERGAKLGLGLHSIHAPFYGMDDMWHDEDGELWQIMKNDLIKAIDNCAELDVPLCVMHAIIGMDNHTPTELGLERIAEVVDRAVKRGIKIGFENTEGECYLKALLEKYGDVSNVGFTFDSGHELCYNYASDMLGKYGKHLVSVHLDDNFGMTNPDEMTFLDDYHLLPFDGSADWNGIAERLHKCGFNDSLVFELDSKGKPGRTANDIYHKLSHEEYIGEAYNRAVKFREMFMSVKQA